MHTLLILADSPLDLVRDLVALLLSVGVVYALVFLPRSKSGFYSWHPVKRVLTIVFFPFALFYWWATSGCFCARCRHTDENTLFLFFDSNH